MDTYKVLYIEDNEANMQLVELVLARKPKFIFLSAMDGRSGIAIAEQERPDVILLDLSLPDMSGLEVLQKLKEIPELAQIPVISLSGGAEPDSSLGFFSSLNKPLDIMILYSAIDEALGLSK